MKPLRCIQQSATNFKMEFSKASRQISRNEVCCSKTCSSEILLCPPQLSRPSNKRSRPSRKHKKCNLFCKRKNRKQIEKESKRKALLITSVSSAKVSPT